MLDCPNCNAEFTHSEIDLRRETSPLDPFAWIVDKPKIPEAGILLECPNCKKVSLYKRHQFMYRAA
jgi:hypothetical protein